MIGCVEANPPVQLAKEERARKLLDNLQVAGEALKGNENWPFRVFLQMGRMSRS